MKKACVFLDLTEWFTFVAKIWELENLVTSLPFSAWLNLSAAMSTTIFLWCGFLQFSTRQYRNIKVKTITSFKSNWINEPILYLHLAKSVSNTNGTKNPQPHPQACLRNGLLFIQNASLDLSSYGKWNMTFASIFYSFVCFQLPIQTQQTGFRLDIYASKHKYKKGPQPCLEPYTRFRDFAQLVANCAFSWSFKNWTTL